MNLPRLTRQRWLARWSMLAERAWPEFSPVAALLVLFVCAALLDGPQRLPPLLHAAVLAVVVLSSVLLLRRGFLRITKPSAPEIDRRLEAAAGLRHRPLATLFDRPAGLGDPTLWRAHREAATRAVDRLRWPPPRLSLGPRDPFALQGLLVIGLIACLAIAGTDAPARLGHALWPTLPRAAPVAPPTVTAWATPPGYTGLPPFALPPADGAKEVLVSLPEGSRVDVAVGGAGATTPVLAAPQPAAPTVEPLDPGNFRATAQPTADGALTVGLGAGTLARWRVSLIPDVAPVVAWSKPPAATRARIPAVRFQYTATHAYGVTAMAAEVRLRDRPDAPPLMIPLPLPGASAHSAHGSRTEDLTAHPWAGLTVAATPVGRDGAGKEGRGSAAVLLLPERTFSHPMAKALIAARRALVLGSPAPVADQLDALADDAPAWAQEPAGLAQLRALIPGLRANPSAVDAAETGLWTLALKLEEGGPARTAAALARAQTALREGLAAHADRAEIERRAQTLKDALERHAQALAEARRRDPAAARPNLDPARKALDKLRQASRDGKPDEAQADMAELDRALQELREANRDEAARARARSAQARQKGARNQTVMGDMLKREGTLLDHAQGREAGNDPPRGSLNFPPGGLNDAYRDPSLAARDAQPNARAADANIQAALRRVLGELMSTHGELTGKVPPELGRADQAMRDGATALRAGQDGVAAANIQRAIEALQKGGQSMRDQVRQKFGPPSKGGGEGQDGQDQGDQGQDGQGQEGQDAQGQGGQGGQGQLGMGEVEGDDGPDGSGYGPEDQAQAQAGGRDPFGRPLGGPPGPGAQYGDGRETKVPGAGEGGRTRAVQEELRRRGADQSRPPEERDYIGRLLGPQ